MSWQLGRRRFIGLAALSVGGGLAAAGAVALPGLWQPGQPGTLLHSRRPLPEPYQVPLPVPPVLRPGRQDATTDYYDIIQQTGHIAVFDGIRTPAWTYQGTFPGPTIISQAGRRTVVRHTNRLPHPVVVHLHGGHTPHDSDGYPKDLILPADSTTSAALYSGCGSPAKAAAASAMPEMADMGSWPGTVTVGDRSYVYPLDQRAATLWYHDHRMGFTGPSVWYGLAGFHLVRDAAEDALPLPDGDRDLPVMITDRSFDAEGRLQYPSVDPALTTTPGVQSAFMNGVLGDVILVNGAPWPVLAVRRRKYRFRFLNASNARRYRLALDPPPPGGAGFTQIGSDGGLLDRPLLHDVIETAPAERFDVVIDFARYRSGAQVQLRNTLGSGSTARVMRFDVTGAPALRDPDMPATLSTIAALSPKAARVTRTFVFQNQSQGWTINSQVYDPAHPLAYPRLGQPEIWRFITDLHHPIHLHLNHFQVLSRNNGPPGPYDHGWKDTLDLNPAESAEIIVKFTSYPGRFLFHCHNLEHEDMAMMADFITA